MMLLFVAIQVTVIANQRGWGAASFKLMETSIIATILLLVGVNGVIIGRSGLIQLMRKCKLRRFKKKRESVIQEKEKVFKRLKTYTEMKSNSVFANKEVKSKVVSRMGNTLN